MMLRRWTTWAILAGLTVWEWSLYARYTGADFWVTHGDDPGADVAAQVMQMYVWSLAVAGAVIAGALLAFSWWRSRRRSAQSN